MRKKIFDIKSLFFIFLFITSFFSIFNFFFGEKSFKNYQNNVDEILMLSNKLSDLETEKDNLTYFRLRDFENFLKKNKFFEYKSHKIAQRLRDINGSSTVLKIQNRSVRCWAIPAFENADMELNPPNMGKKEETPF